MWSPAYDNTPQAGCLPPSPSYGIQQSQAPLTLSLRNSRFLQGIAHNEEEKTFSVDSGGHVLLPDLPQAWARRESRRQGERRRSGQDCG